MQAEATRAKELAGLIERLEKATGPDGAIDDLLYWTLKQHPAKGPFARIPAYTDSIDAALGLVERVLPGWMWYVGSVGENDMPQATITEPVEDCRDFVGHAPTAPLAILLALLRALAQESQDAQ